MSHHIRSVLILALATALAVAYSPASFADKKDNSNSANSDDNKDKDKDKNKDDQNNKRRGRDRQKNEEKVSNAVQQLQKSQQNGSNKQSNSDNQQNKSDKQSNSSDKQKSGSDKQGSSKNSQPVIINNGPQNNPVQKTPQFQNIPKQQLPNQKPNNFPSNPQQQSSKDKSDKDKWQDKNDKDKWQNHSHKDHKELNKWVDNFGGPKPFSSKWYRDHPKAWHHNHHDHDDKWKVLGAAGLVSFLGWQAYHSQGPVVVYQPVGYDTLFVNRPNVVIDLNRGEWMPLGVYSLMVGPGDESTRMLDLVVDRFGHIRGSYYDMVSDASYNVAGIIDKRTQYAQWSLESNRQLTFYTPVGEMLQPQGYVNVQLPSGQRQQWQLVRMDDSGY